MIGAVVTGGSAATPWWEWVLIVAAVAAGAAAALLLLRKKPSGQRKPWSDVQDGQVTEDVFDGRSLMEWVKESRDDCAEGMQMLAVKCTKKWVTRLGYEFPEGLDSEHNILACIVDIANGNVLRPRLFSFGEISDTMKARFAGKDELFLQL